MENLLIFTIIKLLRHVYLVKAAEILGVPQEEQTELRNLNIKIKEYKETVERVQTLLTFEDIIRDMAGLIRALSIENQSNGSPEFDVKIQEIYSLIKIVQIYKERAEIEDNLCIEREYLKISLNPIQSHHEILDLLTKKGNLSKKEVEFINLIQEMFKSRYGITESRKTRALELLDEIIQGDKLTHQELELLGKLQEVLKSLFGTKVLSDEGIESCLKTCQELFELLDKRRVLDAKENLYQRINRNMVFYSLDKIRYIVKDEENGEEITQQVAELLKKIYSVGRNGERIREIIQEIAQEIYMLLATQKGLSNANELEQKIRELLVNKKESKKDDPKYQIAIEITTDLLSRTYYLLKDKNKTVKIFQITVQLMDATKELQEAQMEVQNSLIRANSEEKRQQKLALLHKLKTRIFLLERDRLDLQRGIGGERQEQLYSWVDESTIGSNPLVQTY